MKAIADHQYSVRVNFGNSGAGKIVDVGEGFAKKARSYAGSICKSVRKVPRFLRKPIFARGDNVGVSDKDRARPAF